MTRPLALVLMLLLGATVLSLNLGSFRITPGELLQTAAGRGDANQELVLYRIRLPRLTMAVLVGIGLATAGAVLQGVTRNSLADPGILGLTAGAGLAVILLIYLQERGLAVPPGIRPVVAFAGAGLAAAVTFLAARRRGVVLPSQLLLAGIAVNAGLSAVTLVLSMRLDRKLYDQAVTWLAGTLVGRDWQQVLSLLPWLIVLLPILWARSRPLDILGLGDGAATGLGVDVRGERAWLLLAAVGLAGSSVALAGGIGFVGLLGPHLARRLVGPRHGRMLPLAACLGALLVVSADIVARNLLRPVELPVGIVVGAIGAPYFLYLLARAGREGEI